MDSKGDKFTYVRSDSLSQVAMGEDRLIVNLESDQFYAVSDVAALIWEYIEQPVTVEEIVERLSIKFPDISRRQLKDDSTSFLNELMSKGLANRYG